jgi:hypothetical protein
MRAGWPSPQSAASRRPRPAARLLRRLQPPPPPLLLRPHRRPRRFLLRLRPLPPLPLPPLLQRRLQPRRRPTCAALHRIPTGTTSAREAASSPSLLRTPVRTSAASPASTTAGATWSSVRTACTACLGAGQVPARSTGATSRRCIAVPDTSLEDQTDHSDPERLPPCWCIAHQNSSARPQPRTAPRSNTYGWPSWPEPCGAIAEPMACSPALRSVRAVQPEHHRVALRRRGLQAL